MSSCTSAAAQQLVRALEYEHQRRELVVSLVVAPDVLVTGKALARGEGWAQALFEQWLAGQGEGSDMFGWRYGHM